MACGWRGSILGECRLSRHGSRAATRRASRASSSVGGRHRPSRAGCSAHDRQLLLGAWHPPGRALHNGVRGSDRAAAGHGHVPRPPEGCSSWTRSSSSASSRSSWALSSSRGVFQSPHRRRLTLNLQSTPRMSGATRAALHTWSTRVRAVSRTPCSGPPRRQARQRSSRLQRAGDISFDGDPHVVDGRELLQGARDLLADQRTAG